MEFLSLESYFGMWWCRLCDPALYIIFVIFFPSFSNNIILFNILYLVGWLVVSVMVVSFSSYLKGIYCVLWLVFFYVVWKLSHFVSRNHSFIRSFSHFAWHFHSMPAMAVGGEQQIKEKTAKRTQPNTNIYVLYAVYGVLKIWKRLKPSTFFTFPSYFRILRQSNGIDKICKHFAKY